MARRFLEALADALLPSTTDTHEPLESRRPTHIATTPGPHASASGPNASASGPNASSDVQTPDMPTMDVPAVFLSTRGALTPEGTRNNPSLDFQVPESALARIQAIASSWSPNIDPPAPPIRSEPALPAFAAVAAVHAKTPTGTSPPPEAAFDDDDLPTRALPRLVPLPHGAAAEPTVPERRGANANANANASAKSSRLSAARARARGLSRPEDFDELEEIEDFDALEDVDPDFTEIAMIPRKRAQKGRSESTLESLSARQADRRDGASRRHTRLASAKANASDSPKSSNKSTQPTPTPTPKPANAGHVWKLKRMTSVGECAATPTNDNRHGQRTAARTHDSIHAPSRATTEFAEPGADLRPRAARASVLSLLRTLRPLVEELISLPASRRPRRFWGRWREVVGDRGVRRAFVESILYEVDDAYTLACELIAEVHQVQRESVYALVAEIEASDNDDQHF